ncbi:MAG: hypothetical protein ABI846_05595 [Rudaea sp.]
MLRSLRLAFALMCLCNVAAAAPAPAEDSALPAILRDWRGWVLKDLDYRACPFLSNRTQEDAGGFVCAWPGRLALAATADGATFSVRWRVDAAAWIELPGSAEVWPQAVTVNGQRQPVLAHAEAPALWLAPGSYEIAGRLPWRERPQSLRVPAGVGLVALSVDGKGVAPVQRDGDEITLGRGAASAPEADSIDLHVFRLLTDDVPADLVTRIQLAVSGQAREEVLGPVLPAGFAATSLEGEWPARLDNDGRLRVQVQPGSGTLTVRARAIAPLTVVSAHLPGASWPKQEIWSFTAVPRLRMASASAAVAVDPKQAQVPDEWQAFPAFALGDGEKLTIEERSRGLAPDEANRLSLRREAWLDFDGAGWYARDFIGGTMVQGWRFDVAAPYALERAEGHVAGAGEREPLLVTRGANAELSGVEWRTPRVNLSAGVRIAAAASLPASGWQQTFDRIDTTLHLPFAYKLLGAPGADSVQGSWMSRWTLLDVFIAAIAALLAWRLLGVVGAVVAVVYLLLGYQEGAPLWTLIGVLVLSLVVRVLPDGRLLHASIWLRRIALVLFALAALPFLAHQVRFAIYPQLETSNAYGMQYAYDEVAANLGGGVAMNASPPPAAPPPPPLPQSRAMPSPVSAPMVAGKAMAKVSRDSAPLESITVTGARIDKSQLIDHYSQSTVVQTGAGEPHWNLGGTATLSWTGPVLPTQSVRLVVAPPWLVRPLRILLALLLAWLALHTLRSTGALPRRGPAGVAPVALLLVAVGVIAASAGAQAQTAPSDELLRQLRERLTEAPKCAPQCAAVAQAQVEANGDTVSVVLEVHAGSRLAFPLPSVDNGASLRSAKVDDVADAPVARVGDADWLAVDRGVHRVEIVYAADADRLALNFTLKPARLLFSGKGWSASGNADDHLLDSTLTLARLRTEDGAGKPATGVQQFAPYVRIGRSLSLGLDWTVSSEAQRLSPASGGFTLGVPLLPGEHVSTPGIKVQNSDAKGAIATGPIATISVADGAASGDWTSTLDKADTLTLTAPALSDRAEVWRVLVSPTWHVEFAGVPAVGAGPDESAEDYRQMEFHPLPGETLTMKITRPAATQGAVRAIDAVTVESEVGQRSATQTLRFSIRASQGGEHTLTLPAGAEILSVRRDAQTLNLRAKDCKLSLPLHPGAQAFEIRFRDNDLSGLIARTPEISLGLPAANIDLGLQLPADRWLLVSFGPMVGPAVLYWGELLVMLAVAWALARTRRTRLRFVDWLLLGIGFSTFSWGALLIVVAWLFAFDWRSRVQPPAPRLRFNAMQIGLVVLTALALFALVSAIPQGLLGQPDMHVVGNGSDASALRWFADRSADALPRAGAVSLPLWVYKVLMLAWALWLANALIGWLRDGFAAWTRGGYWKARVAAVATASAPAAADEA